MFNDKKDLKSIILPVLLAAVLMFAVLFIGERTFRYAVIEMNTAQIAELASHDVKLINNSIESRLDTLETVAGDITRWVKADGTPVKDLLHADSAFIERADKIVLVSGDGTVLSSSGLLENRPDVLEAVRGQGERFVMRFDNVADIIPDQHREFILYGVMIKPIETAGHRFEYLCCMIKPAELESELKLDIYGGRGFSSVIDTDGNYILNINRSHSFLARDNFFRDFEAVRYYSSVDELRQDLSAADSVISARAAASFNSGEADEYYLVFTPLKELKWLFVSAVPASVLEEQARSLTGVAGLLLGVLGLAMVVVFLFEGRSRRQQGLLREKALTDELNSELQEKQAALEDALALAQSASRAKTTFLNSMSHDIRTPMNAIIGYTGLASAHIDNTEQVKDYLAKIGRSSEHLLSLINDVLDMSRIESGRVNIQEKEEDLSEILHTLRSIVQTDVNSKQLEFYIDSDVEDQYVVCDKLRLNQILLNVLSNSIKYTQPGGTVSLRLRETGRTENGYGRYEFRIKDNGMGMSAEFLETIFEPFTRVNTSTVSGIQGTGLGMAITKNIVDMMGGTIDISSEEGKGTETVMSFEFRQAGKPEAPAPIAELEGLKGLVVDDDMLACRNIAKMLRDVGMHSEWCASGKEAIVRTEEAVSIGELFKVYIIDWLMPDMNGIETARRIRQIVGESAPIIILTAYDWADIEDEAKEAGVSAFVSKPMFPSDLREVLGRCCGIAPDEAPAEEKTAGFRGKKLLLVEDNEMNREIATEILEEAGFIIDTAEDGDVAVDMMRTAQPGQYDLILMDVQMPRMNGYEATRAIRALPDLAVSSIPIIAMTANAFEEDRQNAFAAGMDEHVAKPIDVDRLNEVLAKFLN